MSDVWDDLPEELLGDRPQIDGLLNKQLSLANKQTQAVSESTSADPIVPDDDFGSVTTK